MHTSTAKWKKHTSLNSSGKFVREGDKRKSFFWLGLKKFKKMLYFFCRSQVNLMVLSVFLVFLKYYCALHSPEVCISWTWPAGTKKDDNECPKKGREVIKLRCGLSFSGKSHKMKKKTEKKKFEMEEVKFALLKMTQCTLSTFSVLPGCSIFWMG